MNAAEANPEPAQAARHALEQLRIERRSYIIGTLVVWVVVMATLLILVVSMAPQLFQQPPATSFQDALRRFSQMAPLSAQQQLVLDLILLVGGVALFFLNWRFSFLLQRPRGAFAGRRPGQGTAGSNTAATAAGRWLWWAVLALNSMFYATFLFPQLIVTTVLARWGKQEIALRRAALQAPPDGHSADSSPQDSL